MRLTLKHRVLKSRARRGWHSFFIEVFDGGKRSYESLDIVADPKDKVHYKDVLILCRDIVAKRQLEINGIETGLKPVSYMSGDFVMYCQQYPNKVKNKKSRENWWNAINALLKYEPHGVQFGKIDKDWLEGYQEFLLDMYSQNTARCYSTKIRQVIAKAVQDRLIIDNPNKYIKQIPEKEGEIKYLYFEEVMLLDKTKHRHRERQLAFLFNCFVPVRPGDLISLTESNIRPAANGGFEVYFRQSKKQRIESIPISHQGMVYLQEARELAKKRFERELTANDPIFSVGHKKWFGTMLKAWAKRAYEMHGHELPQEIRYHFSWACEDISPHWARHTGASMLLNAGASLEAIGDILGHRHRKTTMRYAKIHPQTKHSTIAMMPRIEDNDDKKRS